MRSTSTTAILATLLLLAMVGGTRASAIAYDSAGDSAYNSSDTNPQQGLNGGYGWGGGWVGYGWYGYGIQAISPSSYFGETGAVGAGIINSPQTAAGRTWWMQPSQNASFNGYVRPLSGDLAVGQTFSVDFAATFTSAPGSRFFKGSVGLYNYDAKNGPSFYSIPGIGVGAEENDGKDFVILHKLPLYDAPIDTGIPLADEAVHMDVTLISAGEAQITVTSLASDHLTATAIVPVSSALGAIGAHSIVSYGGATYFNNIAVTPEPAASGLLLLIAASLALRRTQTRVRGFGSAHGLPTSHS